MNIAEYLLDTGNFDFLNDIPENVNFYKFQSTVCL